MVNEDSLKAQNTEETVKNSKRNSWRRNCKQNQFNKERNGDQDSKGMNLKTVQGNVMVSEQETNSSLAPVNDLKDQNRINKDDRHAKYGGSTNKKGYERRCMEENGEEYKDYHVIRPNNDIVSQEKDHVVRQERSSQAKYRNNNEGRYKIINSADYVNKAEAGNVKLWESQKSENKVEQASETSKHDLQTPENKCIKDNKNDLYVAQHSYFAKSKNGHHQSSHYSQRQDSRSTHGNRYENMSHPERQKSGHVFSRENHGKNPGYTRRTNSRNEHISYAGQDTFSSEIKTPNAAYHSNLNDESNVYIPPRQVYRRDYNSTNSYRAPIDVHSGYVPRVNNNLRSTQRSHNIENSYPSSHLTSKTSIYDAESYLPPQTSSFSSKGSSWAKTPKFIRTYEESSEDEQIFDESQYYNNKREKNVISCSTIKCDAPIIPLTLFTDLNLPSNLHEYLKCMTPTSIQSYAIPAILKNKNVICRAPTGIGKTISFLVPLILKLSYTKRPKLRILILAPTRELALQIKNEVDKLLALKNNNNEGVLENTYVKALALYGGMDMNLSRESISSGCDILIATPGRLSDFLERRYVTLKNVKFFVLDEADRMLEMGFEKEMNFIKSHLKKDIYTYMFSATFESKLKRIVGTYLGSDKINIEFEHETVKNIKQELIHVNSYYEKNSMLSDLLHKASDSRVLVFVETKVRCKEIENYCNSCGLFSVSLHGDKVQREREYALSQFSTGKCNVLVATSVAARGLDIPEIGLVINYDLPRDIKEYIHRIGRSGRCGKKGRSISFFMRTDELLKNDLVGVLNESGNEVPVFLTSRNVSNDEPSRQSKAPFSGREKFNRGGYGSRIEKDEKYRKHDKSSLAVPCDVADRDKYTKIAYVSKSPDKSNVDEQYIKIPSKIGPVKLVDDSSMLNNKEDEGCLNEHFARLNIESDSTDDDCDWSKF